FFVPLCGSAVSDCADVCRNASDTQPGPRSGMVDSSKPGFCSRFDAGGGADAAVTETLSNTAVFDTLGSWLVTAIPATLVPGVVTVTEPTVVHAVPSDQVEPVICLSQRASF